MGSKNWLNWKTRIRSINKINKSDLLYLSGLIDGEGCIGLNTVGSVGKQNLHPQITITNTNKEILDWVIITIGKGVVEEKPRTNDKWKTAYSVRINGHHAVQLAQKLEPYLRIKKLQAQVLIKFKETMQIKRYRRKLDPEVSIERKRLKTIITTLNKRGPSNGNGYKGNIFGGDRTNHEY